MVQEPKVNEVLLFGQRKGPYGDSRVNARRPGSYKSTMHMLPGEGVLTPYFTPNQLDLTATKQSPPVKAIEWVNNSGDPIILIAMGAPLATGSSTVIARLDPDGTLATDKSQATAVPGKVNPLVLHSDGGTTPQVFMCFGVGGGASMIYRGVATGWFACTGDPNYADGLFSENGNLWATLGHQVRKWAAGTNPVTATAGAAVNVGNAGWDITGVGLLARSYIVFIKPDGIYVYDIDTNRFENIWGGLAENPHPDTGKGSFTWGSNLCIPLGWGGMVMLTPGLEIIPISPLPAEANGDREVPGRSRVLAMAADAKHLYASIEPFWRRLGSGEVGVLVRTTSDGSAFNDRDVVAGDDDLSTNFTLADVSPASANSAIYIGTEVREGGIWLDLDSLDSPGGSGNLEYWDGSSWQSVAYTDWTSRFLHTGAFIPDALIPDDWATGTIDGVADKYWLRLMFTAGSPDANHKVREVRVFPDPQPLPVGEDVSLSGFDEAGLRTHILRGSFIDGVMEWDDIASLEGDGARLLMFTQLEAISGAKNFVAIGVRDYTRLEVGYSGEPQAESYPEVQNSFASLWRSTADNRLAQNEQAPTTQKLVEYLSVYGRWFDTDNDKVQAWIRYDGGEWTFLGRGDHLPTRFRIPLHESSLGYEYEVVVSLYDGVRDLEAPEISAIIAGVRAVEGDETEVVL